jgi:uncharacterized membrane protein (UPF0127 family)
MLQGYLYIKDYIFSTLLAISDEEKENGLMFIEPPTPVMSFIYRIPQINKFWMKNTPAPLDIVFCLNGKIDKICNGTPYSTEIITNNNLSDLVIELPEGTCKKMGFKEGDPAGLVKPIDYIIDINRIKNNLSYKLNI